jgi:hypothetical protein
MRKEEHYIEVVALIVFGLIAVHLLFINPVIGLSDNGDFERIMGSAGLGYIEPNDNDYFGFVHTHFMLKPFNIKNLSHYFSTHNIPVIVAKNLSRISFGNIFNIKCLALIYVVCLLFSFFVIIKNVELHSNPAKLCFVFILLIILSDAHCLSYFNSLYGEPVAYVSLISLVACYLTLLKQPRPKTITLLLMFFCMFMMVGAKLQYNVLSVFVICLLLMMFKIRNDSTWRITAIICSILTIIYAICFNMVISKPLANMTIYNSVFYGILKDSQNIREDLVELGLSTEFSVLVNTTRFEKNRFYDLDSDYFKTEFFNKINYQKVIGYYLTHPGRLVQKMEVTANKSMQNDKIKLGSYKRESGYKFMTITNRFNLWTELKGHLLPKTLLFMIPFYGVFYVLSLIEYIKTFQHGEKRIIELLWFISFVGLLQFPMPVIGNGEADTYKQLFLFNLTYDILILVSITYGLTKIVNVFGSSKASLVETRRRHNENR